MADGGKSARARLSSALVSRVAAFNRATSRGGKFVLGMLLFFIGLAVIQAATEAYKTYKFNHLSSAKHLAAAKSLCLGLPNNCFADDLLEPADHLEKIPPSALEYSEAAKLLSSIHQQQDAYRRAREKAIADAAKRDTHAEDVSREQMLRNVRGEAHDSFSCGRSTDNKMIMSFDGRYWWLDDGRCAAREQKKRDEEAQLRSYWPTTVRVDTDMDSFWLADEERTCQTYPDEKGRVSVVACNATGSHRDHNIPVRFWGGIDRNVVSDWKCRREKNLIEDQFVCRAID